MSTVNINFVSIMNSYMALLKYDFEEFGSKHWLYTDTSADISNETPVISNVDPETQLLYVKIANKSKMDHKGKQKSLH